MLINNVLPTIVFVDGDLTHEFRGRTISSDACLVIGMLASHSETSMLSSIKAHQEVIPLLYPEELRWIEQEFEDYAMKLLEIQTAGENHGFSFDELMNFARIRTMYSDAARRLVL